MPKNLSDRPENILKVTDSNLEPLASLSIPLAPPRAYVILLAAQIAIGAAAIFARWALTGTGPIMASALRLCIATVLIFAYRILCKRGQIVSRGHELLFAFSGICLALHFAFWITSLLYTSVAISTLLVCTSPLWTALWDLLRGVDKPRPMFFVCFLLGAAGVGLIAFAQPQSVQAVCDRPANFGGFHLSSPLLGDGLALAGGLAIAAYLIAVRRVSQTYSTSTIVLRTYAWASAGLVVATIFSGEPWPSGGLSWGGIWAMALVSQLLGHTAINSSLRWLSSSTVAMATLLEPVLAALLAAALFHEALTPAAIGGSFLVLLALFGVIRPPLTTVVSE